MVRARLHTICGNCGCNDEFTHEWQPFASDNGDGTFESDLCLKCNNCGTLHWISDNSEHRPEDAPDPQTSYTLSQQERDAIGAEYTRELLDELMDIDCLGQLSKLLREHGR